MVIGNSFFPTLKYEGSKEGYSNFGVNRLFAALRVGIGGNRAYFSRSVTSIL